MRNSRECSATRNCSKKTDLVLPIIQLIDLLVIQKCIEFSFTTLNGLKYKERERNKYEHWIKIYG
jgi:hypothetical protein